MPASLQDRIRIADVVGIIRGLLLSFAFVAVQMRRDERVLRQAAQLVRTAHTAGWQAGSRGASFEEARTELDAVLEAWLDKSGGSNAKRQKE